MFLFESKPIQNYLIPQVCQYLNGFSDKYKEVSVHPRKGRRYSRIIMKSEFLGREIQADINEFLVRLMDEAYFDENVKKSMQLAGLR